MAGKSITMLAVGDLVLEDEHGERFISLAAPTLKLVMLSSDREK